MDIKGHNYRTEYILPCAINIPSEDDIVIDIVTNVSMVYLFITYVKYFNYSNFNLL